jgi:propionyl-CoA carboxylase alpha chain
VAVEGMRVVENEAEFESQMNRAISEALNAFGDGSVFIEKYVALLVISKFKSWQIATEIFLYLFERECSIQHQKVVEEAPSSVLTPNYEEKWERLLFSC